jgi:two-component system sensor histidine kinase UhpB
MLKFPFTNKQESARQRSLPFLPIGHIAEEGPLLWRERIMFAIYFSGIVVGSFALVSSTSLALRNGYWYLVVVYILAYLCAIVITFVRRISFPVRAWCGLMIFYILGMFALVTGGPAGSGRLWLFSFSLVAVLLLGVKVGVLALIINATTLLLLGWLMSTGTLVWPVIDLSLGVWTVGSATFIFMNTIVTVSVAVLFRGLEEGLGKERKLSEDLAESNQHLQKEMAERRRAEETVQQSESKYRSLVELTSDWIWEVDQSGVYTYVSPKVKDLLGYEPEELIGTRPFELMPPDEGRRVNASFASIAASKETFEGLENVNLHKDGREVVLETNGVPILDTDGNLMGYRGIDRDITERKRTEEELKNSRQQLRDLAKHLVVLREHERTKIAREVHDELGQRLAVLKMDTFWLARHLPKKQKAFLDKTEAMLGLVDSTIQSVKRISTELRPGLLDDLGLASAIEWQAEEFQKHTGIECRPTLVMREISLDMERSTAIFRIFQEAITNVARHAGATRIMAKLEEGDSQIVLTVKDNGKGFGEKDMSKVGAFGLMGMRERAYAFGGEMDIEGIPGRGTTVTVTIPIG